MTAYIYDALRTPRGVGRAARDDKPGGGLSELNPAELVAQVSDTLLARNDGLATAVSSLTLGLCWPNWRARRPYCAGEPFGLVFGRPCDSEDPQ